MPSFLEANSASKVTLNEQCQTGRPVSICLSAGVALTLYNIHILTEGHPDFAQDTVIPSILSVSLNICITQKRTSKQSKHYMVLGVKRCTSYLL